MGIGVGLESFSMRSNGDKTENPRFFRSEEKEPARVQRKLSKAHKGPPERNKALKVVERVHERIANCRPDFINKVSRELVDRFSVIAFEDLNIRYTLKSHNLAKSISDVAWRMLVTTTESNAAYSGSEVALVDPRKTSQMCSRCGLIVKKVLLERIHNCPECSLSIDRDLNAAMNVLRLGLQSLREIDGSPDL